ncbi:peptidase MA family protein [Leptospira ognonensis]|uniref:peptidase MA family protein n=1 Tax=Leptospira ognonensis TaxID=2484945 RepID=UPI0010823AA7|nr:peptidase MA family protein [Leptospira ognonensis]
MHNKANYFSPLLSLITSICFLYFFNSCAIPLASYYLTLSPESGDTQNLFAFSLISNIGNCETGGDIWARNIQTQGSYCVPVDIISTKSNVIVYKQRGLFVNMDLLKFATEFNDSTYPKLVSAFGEPSDVDKNGKIKILVLDIVDGSATNSAYVAGFYDPVNFFRDGTVSSIRSNYAEILYIDGKELVASLANDPTAFASTAAHEFQHLIRYQYMNTARVTDDTWINEGTSEVASDIAGFGPQTARLSCFRGTETTRCPNGANGISLLSWASTSSSATILKQYAMAYAYMRYLYDISGNNETEKNNFFRASVQGNASGVRAGTASQLMTVFRSSSRFNSSILGSDNPTVFFNTFMLFFGQASAITGFSSIDYFSASDISSSTISNKSLASAYLTYPFESTLNDLITSPLPAVTGNLTFQTGSSFVLNTNYNLTSISSKFENMGTVKNLGNTKTLVGWGAYSSSSPLTAIRGSLESKSESTGADRYKSLIQSGSTSETLSPLPLCGTQFIDEPVRNVESIPVELPASKNDSTL